MDISIKPQELTDLEIAFPAHVQHLMPAYANIPDEFKEMRGNTWVEFQQEWFFKGLPEETKFELREGIDSARAVRHLKAIQGSFEPKHEHKEAAVAYLASLWFRRVVTPYGTYGEDA